MKFVAALLLLGLSLAGCSQPAGDHAAFDGDAAFALLDDFVYDNDGNLRERTPTPSGDDGEGFVWIRSQTIVPGWSQSIDRFDGRQYMELDKGSVDAYTQAPYCSAEDARELADLEFRNVYATLPGTDPEAGHVVLAAHWDAKEDAHGGAGPIPAANDGASGVAVLVQLQHHIHEHALSFPFELTMAYFDGEDGFEDCHPLAGSLWSARNHDGPNWPLAGMTQLILLDMVGDADARFIRESHSTNSDGALVDAIWNHATTTDLTDNFVDTRRPISDDHVPFIEEGFPAIDLIDAGRPDVFPPYWHTMDDTPDKLSPDMLGRMGDLLMWMLTDPATQALLQD